MDTDGRAKIFAGRDWSNPAAQIWATSLSEGYTGKGPYYLMVTIDGRLVVEDSSKNCTLWSSDLESNKNQDTIDKGGLGQRNNAAHLFLMSDGSLHIMICKQNCWQTIAEIN